MTESVCVSAMRAGKSTYASPKLKIFGLFSELTAAGSGPVGENVNSANRNQKP
jgi:hypothetical protein